MRIEPAGRLAEMFTAAGRPDLLTGFDVDDQFFVEHVADVTASHPELQCDELAALAAYSAYFHPNAPHHELEIQTAPHTDLASLPNVQLMNAQLRDSAANRDSAAALVKTATESILVEIAGASRSATESAAVIGGAIKQAITEAATISSEANRAAGEAHQSALKTLAGAETTGAATVAAAIHAHTAAVQSASDFSAERDRRAYIARWIQVAILLVALTLAMCFKARAQATGGVIIRGSNGVTTLVTRNGGLINLKCDGTTIACSWSALTNSFTLTANQNTTGNAATATALAANGTNCSAGNYPLGVDASGNAEGCTAAPFPKSANTGSMQFAFGPGATAASSGVLLFPSSNGALSCTSGAGTSITTWPASGWFRNLQVYTTTAQTARFAVRYSMLPDCYALVFSTVNFPNVPTVISLPGATAGTFSDTSGAYMWQAKGGIPAIDLKTLGGNVSSGSVLGYATEFVDVGGAYPTILNQGNPSGFTASQTCFLAVWHAGAAGIPCSASPTTAFERQYSMPMPVSGTVSDMWVSPLNTVPAANVVYTMRKNAANATEALTLATTDTLPELLWDTAHTDSVAAGDYVVINAATGAGTQALAGRWGYKFTPTGGTTHTLVGWMIANTPSTTTTYYIPDSGINSTTLASAELPVPLGAGCLVANLSAVLAVAPNAGVTDTFTVLDNGVSTGVTGTITSATALGFVALDGTHTATVALGHLLTLSVAASGASSGTIGGVSATCN